MTDFKPTIVQANDLTKASYSLNINELRLINLACSKVDSKGQPVGDIFIANSEYEEVYGLSRHKRTYAILREASDTLLTKPIKLYDRKLNRITKLSWLAKIEYSPDDGAGVYIQFSHLIEPYLFEIKERFTSIDFEIATRLNTPFSFRLYQWLKEAEHKTTNKKNNGVIELELGIEWIKEQAQIQGNYPVWKDFNERVLKPALERINTETDISVIHQPIKTGRKTTAVKFTYVQEHYPLASKPVRPRLHRRPKVVAGSHAEGEWMKANFKILDDYSKLLFAYDPKALMDLADLRKYAEYAKLVNPDLAKKLSEQIADRTRK